MKILHTALCASLLALPMAAFAAGPGCDAVNFAQEVLAKFPNAAKGCMDVSERNGGIYVHYVAKVVKVEPDGVTAEFIDVKGKPYTKVKFMPAEDKTVSVAGKAKQFTQLKKGDKLDFWVEHSRWGLFASEAGKNVTIISQENYPDKK